MSCHPTLLVTLCVGVLLIASADAAFAQKSKTAPTKLQPNSYYECLLGVYTNDSKPVPFTTLAIPDGENMLSDAVIDAMRGRITIGEIGYSALGKIHIATDGQYEFDNNVEQILLHDTKLGFDRKPGKINIKKGVYSIAIKESNHGQPYLQAARIAIKNTATGERIPIFNSGRDIQQFVNTPINGTKSILIHEFDPEKAKLDLKLPKR